MDTRIDDFWINIQAAHDRREGRQVATRYPVVMLSPLQQLL